MNSLTGIIDTLRLPFIDMTISGLHRSTPLQGMRAVCQCKHQRQGRYRTNVGRAGLHATLRILFHQKIHPSQITGTRSPFQDGRVLIAFWNLWVSKKQPSHPYSCGYSITLPHIYRHIAPMRFVVLFADQQTVPQTVFSSARSTTMGMCTAL